jgi:hypothetical protein
MAEWVMVNGARIERSFLEENVEEAEEYVWVSTHWDQADDHGHCMVCNVTLVGSDPCYGSDGGWLCEYCFEAFIAQREPQTGVS